VVAMSGGVDSSVAASLLVEQGYEVVGVTLKLLPKMDSSFGCCGSPADVEDAKRVCETLGISHYTMNAAELFEEKVISPFVHSYAQARTPNPCVECNRSIKFHYLMNLAKAWDADFLATGHYARIENTSHGPYHLLKARDLQKDQSYFLYILTQEKLQRTLFPVGEMNKGEVRERARQLGLKTAEKPDSHEVCFVSSGNYRDFLQEKRGIESVPGPIVNTAGHALGEHQGLMGYTVGQRKGLGISVGHSLYVVGMETNSNTLVVGEKKEAARDRFWVSQLSWVHEPQGSLRAEVKIRYRHPGCAAELRGLSGGRAEVNLEVPQQAVTPGQSAVFYRGEEVLGGGIIDN
ncbi:MAG: tRNA 2-thiouridine(34) synthase MnmA, partial [Elusimicrobia bacterium]|nr:tRNA 2-thiouridine(34) synthase MnmA [Elusimicrobiota bacterium]